MNDIIETTREVLTGANFTVRQLSPTADGSGAVRGGLVFENDTVIGFVLAYETVAALLSDWRVASDALLSGQAELLGAAGRKAWNTYLVLLAGDDPNFGGALALGQIEEDLEGVRKIARAGVNGLTTARAALLPLLPFRTAPVLDPVDMPAEIRERAGELNSEVVRAFLSRADQSVVLQIVEDVLSARHPTTTPASQKARAARSRSWSGLMQRLPKLHVDATRLARRMLPFSLGKKISTVEWPKPQSGGGWSSGDAPRCTRLIYLPMGLVR